MKSYDLALQYLFASLEHSKRGETYYNIGYTFECKMKERRDLYHVNYMLALELGLFNSANQLGLYYEHTKHDIALAEKYYTIASDNGVLQGVNNLISLYKHDYPKRIKTMSKKYSLTHNVMEMLNNQDYAGYCRVVKKLNQQHIWIQI